MNPYRSLGPPVHALHAGTRVDAYLGQRFRFRSRTQWTHTCRKGEVRVQGRFVGSAYRLRRGDVIDYYCPATREPAVATELPIVWQEGPLMAIAKPPNLPMHEAGAYREHTFAVLVQKHYGPEWAAVHRLDRETSGLVLCGASPESRALVSQLIFTHQVKKSYLAIALGCPEQDSWRVDIPMGQTTETRFRTKQWINAPLARPATTDFRVIDKSPTACLLHVQPLTGRTHQIRVHAACKDLPLVGDKKYHPDESIYLEYLDQGFTERVQKHVLVDRLALHATQLSLPHPLRKSKDEILTINCPLPQDLESFWQALKQSLDTGHLPLI